MAHNRRSDDDSNYGSGASDTRENSNSSTGSNRAKDFDLMLVENHVRMSRPNRRNANQRNANQQNAIQRNANQRNATERNENQRHRRNRAEQHSSRHSHSSRHRQDASHSRSHDVGRPSHSSNRSRRSPQDHLRERRRSPPYNNGSDPMRLTVINNPERPLQRMGFLFSERSNHRVARMTSEPTVLKQTIAPHATLPTLSERFRRISEQNRCQTNVPGAAGPSGLSPFQFPAIPMIARPAMVMSVDGIRRFARYKAQGILGNLPLADYLDWEHLWFSQHR